MKIKEIPLLDYRISENKQILVDKFNEIKPVVDKRLTFDDFDLDRLISLTSKIINKKNFYLSGVSFLKNRQCVNLTNEKDETINTYFVALSTKELFLKLSVYCYFKKVNKNEEK